MKDRPNFLLILTDHWRGDSLGRLGHPVAETPHLDSMTAGGVTFTRAFSPCPSCIAARRSMMTGMTPTTHGMLGYQDGHPWHYPYTLAGELARSGYQTINVGKTHFHPHRLHLGFEELIIPGDYDEWIDRETGMTRARFAHGVHGNSWMSRPNHLPEIQMEETWLTSQAMERLDKRDPERPFFMCLSFNGPHPPWCPPQSYFDYFMRKEMPPPNVGDWAEENAAEAMYPMDVNAWRGKLPPHLNQVARAGYFAYLAYLDAQVGRFIEFLGRRGLSSNTFILFSTDHGEMLGDHHLWRKTYAYDASARIPFIIRPPSSWDVERNIESVALVGLEDIMPTFLAAAGVPIPDTVEGQDLVPILQGDESGKREYYHHEHSHCYDAENAYQCLTSEEWKYVWNPVTGKEHLFNWKDDPNESCDLVDDPAHSDCLNEWRLKMAQHLKDRPENLSDGETLITNQIPVWRDPNTA